MEKKEMKHNSPIKRHASLAAFSRDHHFGLLLCWKINQGLSNAVDAVRISEYVLYFFEEDIRHHFREEEQLVFCRLAEDDAMRLRAEKEHAAIYKLTGQIRLDKKDNKLLKLFADTLRDHIRFEERKLFTYIQQRVGEAALEDISSYQGIDSAEVDAKWKDVFWEIKRT